jgi:SAM-dependent methyltransferase
MTQEQFERSHPEGIQRHYWNIARNHIVFEKLSGRLARGVRALDIGCGPGIALQFLRERGIDCHGVDLGSPRLISPQLEGCVRLSTSAFDLSPAFRRSVGALLLLDVLEHLPAPIEFVGECAAAFPEARTLLVTVPARPEIWSRYDEFFGHYRRYEQHELDSLVSQTSFRLVESGYFFHSLYAAARVLSRIGRQRDISTAAPKFGLVHRAVASVLRVEERLIPGRVLGSSLFGTFMREA